MRRAKLAAAALAFGMLLGSGCAPSDPSPDESQAPSTPPASLPSADPVVAEFVKALNAFDLTKAPTVQPGAEVQEDLKTIFAGMDDIHPTVKLESIEYGDDTAVAHLSNTYPVGLKGWTFASTVDLVLRNKTWVVDWKPSAIHPQLTPDSRLRHQRKLPKRASINDSAGLAVVEERTVYEVGIDKGKVQPADQAKAAADLAALLGIDAKKYQAKVAGGGPRQFVVAATLEQEKIPAGVADVPGGTVAETTALVSADNFATSIIGSTGQPTADEVTKSEGDVFPTDTVGRSGLQARYEKQLRGVPEVRVDLVGRKKSSDGTAAEPVEETNLFLQDASVGTPITISLDRDLQAKAQQVLASQQGVASLVVIRPSDGAVLVAANSPAAGEYSYATIGKYAPGSTFKVVSSLAMLRGGLTPESSVNCPSSLKVGGYTFNNYSDYPSSAVGNITLTKALANSCNTAFAAAAQTVTPEQLQTAAASLGVGKDYDAGFASNFGTVEPNNSAIDRAASMIGQGQITMSPLGMATVAASVAAGKTTLPWVVAEQKASPSGTMLTEQEAGQLRTMMTAVVNEGSGKGLKGLMTGAKTGTAEFGQAGKQQTHAWMIAWNADYAVAAFVEVGKSGSQTAAPLIKALFG